MTGAVLADAVTSGRPLSARAANAGPMVTSSFLIAIISLVSQGPPDVRVCLCQVVYSV
jgi:hypothetical protein